MDMSQYWKCKNCGFFLACFTFRIYLLMDPNGNENILIFLGNSWRL